MQQYNNIRTTKKGPVIEKGRKPLIDVFEEGENIQIVVKMPGAKERKTKVDLQNDVILIKAEGISWQYQIELLLPYKPKPESLTTFYKNGILEIKIAKKELKSLAIE